MPLVDVVVVSYNSREHLRECVEPFIKTDDFNVIVVDNASTDGSLAAVAGLPVTTHALAENGGFARGCNLGWRSGTAPFVLFLNPDARIDDQSVRRLVRVLEEDATVGLAAPRIVGADGSLEFSQRRFPRIRSTYAQALFLHRLLPRAEWTDELVRDPDAYAHPGSPEWVSGACVLVRRALLEQLGGWDEGFFLYSEDVDLCRRMRDAGFDIRYEPEAPAVHATGGSAPRSTLLPVLATSRLRYAEKHQNRLFALIERIGIGLGALTHLLLARGGVPRRAGHARSLKVILRRARPL